MYLNIKQVAERYGVSTWTIRNWVDYKRMPYINLGTTKYRLIRFDPEELKRWEELRRRNEMRKPTVG